MIPCRSRSSRSSNWAASIYTPSISIRSWSIQTIIVGCDGTKIFCSRLSALIFIIYPLIIPRGHTGLCALFVFFVKQISFRERWILTIDFKLFRITKKIIKNAWAYIRLITFGVKKIESQKTLIFSFIISTKSYIPNFRVIGWLKTSGKAFEVST